MSSDPVSVAKRAAIASLVEQGKMKHQTTGIYFEGGTEEQRALVPKYDLEVFQREFPDMIQFALDMDDQGDFTMTIYDGNKQEMTIELGREPPPTTEAMVNRVRSHFRSLIDKSGLDELNDMFNKL